MYTPVVSANDCITIGEIAIMTPSRREASAAGRVWNASARSLSEQARTPTAPMMYASLN